MRRLTSLILTAAASAALLSASIATADAQRRGERPLTIRKSKSFLNPGYYPPVGSLQKYVTNQTELGKPAYYHPRSSFGQSTLPGRFGVFGGPD